ncbi:MAG: c-type cytochrome [Rhodospirillaceae bacterium]
MAAAPAAAARGDAAKGERVFQYCFSCHSVDPAETELQGPNLSGIVGRPAAALPKFPYSDAMKARARAGLVWREAELDAYVADPPKFIPGNKMNYFGVKDAQERADLIAYLRAAK